MIIQYTIVSNLNIKDLITEINLKISEGWQPYENLVIKVEPKYLPIYFQTMVKYTSTTDPEFISHDKKNNY